MRVVIHSSENLIFRDGRPFGDEGVFQGGLRRWPMPSTLAGMFRSRIGISRGPDFFSRENPEKRRTNIESILNVGLGPILPVFRPAGEANWQFLFPAPADAQIASEVNADGDKERLIISRYQLRLAGENSGCNLPWRNWLLPLRTGKEKPPSELPAFWNEDIFLGWLTEEVKNDHLSYDDLGVDWPTIDVRVHTSSDPKNGTVKTGQLFASQGIRLATHRKNRGSADNSIELGIAVGLREIESGDNPLGVCHLGGDRKTAEVENLESEFPSLPHGFENQQFLRLILLTPGNFGGWVPDWLMPEKERNAEETPWVKVPGTDVTVRLRSAFAGRWEAVSGYDYDLQAPKATRKLVPAGSVYLIELQSPGDSLALAEHLWLRSIGEGQSAADGYGCVTVGYTRKNFNE